MKKIIKIKHIMAILLIFLMSSIVSAGVETGLPYTYKHFAPDETYTLFDFEEGTGHFDPITTSQDNGTVEFVNVFANNRDQIWSYNDAEYSLMHVYPQNAFFQDDGITPVNYTYLINGRYAASTVVELYIGGYYTGTYGVIEFPQGTNHISFLMSTGHTATVSVFNKQGLPIDTTKVERNIDRVSLPNGPSTWSLVYSNTLKSDIYSIQITATCNDWLIDDLVIGEAIEDIPDVTTDYSYAAERMKLLIGAQYLKHGTGYDLYTGKYYTADEIKTIPLPYIDLDIKPYDVDWDIGIDNPGAILWAFNQESNVVKWYDLNDQMKHDFTEHVDYENIQPGNVGFIDYPEINNEGEVVVGDGLIDEAFIIVEPIIDESGMVFDCIRIIPEAGVHYSNTEHINSLYNTETSFVDYRRLKDNPKGGHKPYKTIPTNKI